MAPTRVRRRTQADRENKGEKKSGRGGDDGRHRPDASSKGSGETQDGQRRDENSAVRHCRCMNSEKEGEGEREKEKEKEKEKRERNFPSDLSLRHGGTVEKERVLLVPRLMAYVEYAIADRERKKGREKEREKENFRRLFFFFCFLSLFLSFSLSSSFTHKHTNTLTLSHTHTLTHTLSALCFSLVLGSTRRPALPLPLRPDEPAPPRGSR